MFSLFKNPSMSVDAQAHMSLRPVPFQPESIAPGSSRMNALRMDDAYAPVLFGIGNAFVSGVDTKEGPVLSGRIFTNQAMATYDADMMALATVARAQDDVLAQDIEQARGANGKVDITRDARLVRAYERSNSFGKTALSAGMEVSVVAAAAVLAGKATNKDPEIAALLSLDGTQTDAQHTMDTFMRRGKGASVAQFAATMQSMSAPQIGKTQAGRIIDNLEHMMPGSAPKEVVLARLVATDGVVAKQLSLERSRSAVDVFQNP